VIDYETKPKNVIQIAVGLYLVADYPQQEIPLTIKDITLQVSQHGPTVLELQFGVGFHIRKAGLGLSPKAGYGSGPKSRRGRQPHYAVLEYHRDADLVFSGKNQITTGKILDLPLQIRTEAKQGLHPKEPQFQDRFHKDAEHLGLLYCAGRCER
jgi:hypothetical protein